MDAPEDTAGDTEDSKASQQSVDSTTDDSQAPLSDNNTDEIQSQLGDHEEGQQAPDEDLNSTTDAGEIADRLEVLIPSFLDTAEATNTASEVSRQAAATLENGLLQLQEHEQKLVTASHSNAQLSHRILLGSVAALLVALGLFTFMAFQLSDRVTKVDGMIIAVSKRVVEMNSALSTFEAINETISELAVQQQKFADNQLALAKAIAETQTAAEDLREQLPIATAEGVAEKTNSLTGQIASLEQSLDGQIGESAKISNAVTNLGKRLGALEGKIKNVSRLNTDLEALIKLERDNYLQVLRRQADLEEARQRSEQGGTVIADPTIVVYPIHAQYQQTASQD